MATFKIPIKKVKDLAQVKTIMKNYIGHAMELEAEETIRAVVEKHVKEDVYDAYQFTNEGEPAPKVYQRRYDDGGLIDRDNMIGVLDLNGKTVAKYKARLFFYNITPKNPKVYLYTKGGGYEVTEVAYNKDDYLAPLIEEGTTKNYQFEWTNQNNMTCPPRPFMYNSWVELKQHDYILEDDIAKGMERQGFTVKRR